MLIIFRIIAASVTFWAIVTSPNFGTGLFHFVVGLLTQFALFMWQARKEVQIMCTEALAILRKHGTWLSTNDLCNAIIQYRLDREMETGVLTRKDYKKREQYLHAFGPNVLTLRNSLQLLERAGYVVHRSRQGDKGPGSEWSFAPMSDTFGPWGKREADA